MRWVTSPDSSHKEGRSPLSSGSYIAERAEPGPEGVSRLHEQVMAFPQSQNTAPDIPKVQPSSACWGQPFDSLHPDDKLHAWFTDGSSRWKGGDHCGQRQHFILPRAKFTTEMEGGSSQLAVLAAVALPLQNTTGPIHIYTDSWANGIAVWMGTGCIPALTPSSRHHNRDRVPLDLTYHPTSLRIQHVILRKLRHRQQDPITKHIFHLRSVHRNRQDLPVATHFNSASHSHSDMSIHGLLYCHDEAKPRLEEQHLIYRLGSLQPFGLNIEFSHSRCT
ncbi:uncharacterized protein LOC132385781 [Hypanus sabinus]|uniref:uncharacterized protein LOC132385781 n=1 Tax=Hypanus sabinus TaxID=79690 RepID=UPI0028C3773C|nr:uncharacterized protein LOC132385781 [Hypanus sabinus]